MFTETQGTIIGVLVVVYFLLLFGVAVYINKKSIKTYDDYNVAGRTVSIFPLILTFVGTAIGGSILLGYMENGYNAGMSQQWINVGILSTGVIMAGFLAKKIRAIGAKHNMVTIGDFTALRYGEAARIPTVICVLLAYCAITGMQFVAIATILNLTMGIGMTAGILISWLMLTAKTYIGGLKAVIWQDAVHGTIQTVGVFILFFVILYASGGFNQISANVNAAGAGDMLVPHFSGGEMLVFFFTLGAYQLVRQDLWQRFWAAKNENIAIKGYWASIIVGFLVGVVVVATGVYARYGLGLENINPTFVYYEAANAVFGFPMLVIMIVALMATVISCADSFFMAGSSSIINDIVKPRMKNASDKQMLQYSRFSVIVVSIIAVLLALYMPQLVTLWVTGTAMLVAGLLAPVVLGLYWKRITRAAGIAAMWFGLVIAVVWQIAGHPFGIHPVFIGLPVSIATIVLFTLLAKEEEETAVLSKAKAN